MLLASTLAGNRQFGRNGLQPTVTTKIGKLDLASSNTGHHAYYEQIKNTKYKNKYLIIDTIYFFNIVHE